MNKKLLIEFIPLATFLMSGVCALFKVPHASWFAVISGSSLAMVYFYGAFWLLAETGAPMASRIFAGLAFSVNIIGCIFCLLHWPFWKLYGIISYTVLGIMLVICLINFKSAAYKPLLYRCILFLVILSAIYGYRSFAS